MAIMSYSQVRGAGSVEGTPRPVIILLFGCSFNNQ
jgi:hypothetical protein